MKAELRHDPPPRDNELIRNGQRLELPQNHWCRGCEWATCLMNRFLCPFVEGSCARIPETILNPSVHRMTEEMQKALTKKPTDVDCPAESKGSRKYTINGETHSLGVWAYLMGISYSAIYTRIRKGMTPEEAILTPARGQKE